MLAQGSENFTDSTVHPFNHGHVVRPRTGDGFVPKHVSAVVGSNGWLVGWLVRPMRCGVRDVEKEWTCSVVPDPGHRALGDQVCRIARDFDSRLVLAQIRFVTADAIMCVVVMAAAF